MPDNVQSGMSQPLLTPGMRVVLEALDPDTGDEITSVVISDVVISGDPSGETGDDLEPNTPAWVWGDDSDDVV